MLPDAVDLLDERSREAYIGVLIHVAAADGGQLKHPVVLGLAVFQEFICVLSLVPV